MSAIVEQVQEAVANFNLLSEQSLDDIAELQATIMTALGSSDLSEEDHQAILESVSGLISIFALPSSRESIRKVISIPVNLRMVQLFYTIMMQIIDGLNIDAESKANIQGVFIQHFTDSMASGSASISSYETLWQSTSSILLNSSITSADSDLLNTQFHATLKMYWRVSYSDLLTSTRGRPIVDGWYITVLSSLQSSGEISGDDFAKGMNSYLSSVVNVTDEEGMISGSGYIDLSDAFIADMEGAFPDEALDVLYQALGEKLSTFETSTTYSSGQLSLPNISTLTSSVTQNFGVGALKLNAAIAKDFYSNMYVQVVLANLNLSVGTFEEMQILFNTEMTSDAAVPLSHVGEIWTQLEEILVEDGVSLEDVMSIRSTYVTLLQQSIGNNAASVFDAVVPVDNGLFNFLDDITNALRSIVGADEVVIGSYAQAAMQSLYSSLINKYNLDLYTVGLLSAGVSSLLTSNDIANVGISGKGFLQIGCEILEFLQNFLSQEDLDAIGSGLNNFMSTFIPVDAAVKQATQGLIIAVIVLVVAVVIVLSVASGGAAAGAGVAGIASALPSASTIAFWTAFGGFTAAGTAVGQTAAGVAGVAAITMGVATLASVAAIGFGTSAGLIAVSVYLGVEAAGLGTSIVQIGNDDSTS